MIGFGLLGNTGLYLPEDVLGDPSTARAGFLFQDADRGDKGFELSQQSWTDPNSKGYFLFFSPSATRDWTTFAQSARAVFQSMAPAQFAWLSEEGAAISAAAFIGVEGQGTASPAAQAFSVLFRNLTLQFVTDVFGDPATIAFDDHSNCFAIANPPSGSFPSLRLLVTPPGGSQQTYYSQSPAVALPMAGSQAGTLGAAFQFDTNALAQFEAGLMYFAPGTNGDPLVALRYPIFRGAGGASTPLNLAACLDVLEPLDSTRSYFQFTDGRVGSYFTSALGRPFALLTDGGADPSRASRLVLANRPVQTPTSSNFYYLIPAGSFSLAADSTGEGAVPAPGTTPVPLLCGVTGTEYLSVSVGSASAGPTSAGSATVAEAGPDALSFVPAQPAFQVAAPSAGAVGSGGGGKDPVYLDDCDGSVTTSWVQFVSSAGSYVSQPQGSPLYQQNGTPNSQTAAGGNGAPSDLQVYFLDFLALPTWSAAGTASAEAATAAPPVPMAPYAGIPFATDPNLDLDQFLNMEATALNPTRRSAFVGAKPTEPLHAGVNGDMTYAMTPQGLLAGLSGTPAVWSSLQIATSGAGRILQFQNIGPDLRKVLLQNQIFAVISTTDSGKLFDFTDSYVEIGDWTFDLSPDKTKSADGTPPILILKFYPGESIQSLVDDLRLWSQPDTFNGSQFGAPAAQAYLETMIQEACEAVYGAGNCPDGKPSGQPDTNSLYYDFYRAVTDPNFSGVLAVNCNMKLDSLPPAIKAVLGGMSEPSIAGFRVHHVGVQINDTDPAQKEPALAKSSLFALVDYESASEATSKVPGISPAAPSSPDISFYHFQVEYLRALFTNSELRNFACKINLTIDGLFGTTVTLNEEKSVNRRALATGDDDNVIAITGSYQAHSTSDDDTTSGQGVYSFVAEGNFTFDFKEKGPDGKDTSPYLDTITLTKLQFSFDEESPVSTDGPATTTRVASSFGIWGSMVFKDLDVLDIFSFDKLVFADLGIDVGFDLTVYTDGRQPTTGNLSLGFSPGDLRLDLGETKTRDSSTSLLSLIPFKLKSFLYSQDGQTLQSLNYYGFSQIAGLSSVNDRFNYGLIFDLDLGSMGGLVGSLSAFKFSILIGWLDGDNPGIAFGVQLPQADGKLEITIEGVLTISIQQFTLLYATDTTPRMLVLGLQDAYMQVLGTRLPPTGTVSFGLFVPTDGDDEIGWIAAYNQGEDGGAGGDTDGGEVTRALVAGPGTYGRAKSIEAQANGDGSAFELVYLGAGQRVGPDPKSPPTTFAEFLSFMQGEFWTDIKDKKFGEVYHPDSKWLALTDFKLLGMVEVGVVFYDVTPFYSLVFNVTDLFNFEITYTKVTDTIGLFFANLTLPDSLRKFDVGAASLTLPAIGVSVYTNGNWKLDVGFPVADDWSRSFQVEAMAGPVPVTGAGGFYIASLSSATDPDVFKETYPSILAFGFGARLGVGKDFTAGPLKAGVSVTFFGIIQGAAGYLVASSDEIFQKPNALSLQGQFGIIGELYGSVDFVIVKASVNVRLSASIGIVLQYEPPAGNDGSILLYIEASVTVSVRVTINLFLFSVHISFSFQATFRFQWQLAGSAGAVQARERVLAAWTERSLMEPTALSLCPGLSPSVPLWFLPELTVVFADAVNTGAPWFVCSLGVEYDNAPVPGVKYADFKPFEAVTAQLVTFALNHAAGLSGCSPTVTLAQLEGLDQSPDVLVGWIDYPTLLTQLANFRLDITVPDQPKNAEFYRAVFPMLPFLRLSTTGRQVGGKASEFDYQFLANNPVPASYIQTIDDYFNQLFVNQSQGDQPVAEASADADPVTPLIQEIFLDYFTGLIRGAVHQLLQQMQDETLTDSPLDTLMCNTVGAGGFKSLAGQMSGSFRGGARLPYLAGQTVPGGPANPDTNPLYALQWQEFPVGEFGPSGQYTIALANPDTTAPWVTTNVSYSLLAANVSPYQALRAGDVAVPTAPVQLPFTDTGPQAFPFQNAIAWTRAGQNTPASLRPFPTNLTQLQSALGGSVDVLVESRETGAPYLPGGTPLAPTDFAWTTMLDLTVAQVPAGTGASMLEDVYSLSGASQANQLLLRQILAALQQGTAAIASIQVLYQSASGASGLISGDTATRPQNVFLLRTNTTTVSAPPAGLELLAAMASPGDVAVGAQIDDSQGFLQILEQASVTNAPGYYLRYRDAENNPLPADLFSSGPAPITVLVTYKPAVTQNQPTSPTSVLPYYNATVLSQPTASLLYYAETTDPALDIQYIAVAAGSVGAQLTRSEVVMQVRPPQAVAQAGGLQALQPVSRTELIQTLHAAGVTDETDLAQMLIDAGAAPSQLNALYSLVTYQVQKTTGFIESNLSAPVQPQKPAPGDTTSTYRVFVPLYNVAEANQGLPPSQAPNRYASLPDPFSVEFFVNDAFGNQLPTALPFAATNYYFDPIIPIDQWLGVVPSFDALVGTEPRANSLTCYLTPSTAAFDQMDPSLKEARLALYQSIHDQITAQGVSFYVETNLALQADGRSLVQVELTQAQKADVVNMVGKILSYLNGTGPLPGPADGVKLPVAVTGPGPLPPVFEIAVLFGIQRDPALISPLLKDQFGDVTFPSAQNVNSAVPSTVGSAVDGVTVDINTFAANFVQAFPALTLSVALTGTTQPAQHQSSTGLARARLRALGMPGDGTGDSHGAAQSLWAAQTVLLDVSIGTSSGAGPRYLSPKPLDNSLNSATVPLPKLAPSLPQLPAANLFVDIDLDRFNQTFFQAVDNILAPASAANAFEKARTAYTTITTGREALAQEYADQEVDWLFSPQSPFTGTLDQLVVAQEVFEQQMRAALMTAYSVDTVVQYDAAWSAGVPAAADGMLELFGQVQPRPAPAGPSTDGAPPSKVSGLSTAHVAVTSTGTSPLTFLYGVPDVEDTAEVVFDNGLDFNVTHLQFFLAPESATPPDQARPSIWLQLVNPYPSGLPSIGPAGQKIVIPIVYRQYPTPPSLLSQSWSPGTPVVKSNPLVDGAVWNCLFSYQAQLTPHDQIDAVVTYNTDLSASSGGQDSRALAAADQQFSLFEALARFNATYGALQSIVQNLDAPNWAAAVSAIADRVTEVVQNSDWNGPAAWATAGRLERVVDDYTVTDLSQSGQGTGPRLITLAWDASQGQSSFPGATVSIQAADPTTQLPYPGQILTRPVGQTYITDAYTPDPPLVDDWVLHQLEVDNLNVLAAENGLAGVQLSRNVVTMAAPDGTTWASKPEFVYTTPLVRAPQPVTPFIVNSTPVDVALLPTQGGGPGCPESPSSLCQRIYTIMNDLLADPAQVSALLAAHLGAGLDTGAQRRVKVACSYQYPMPAATGGAVGEQPISPLVPVVLARSFVIDATQPDQLGSFAYQFADAINGWSRTNGVVFGPAAQPAGAQFVFDITLYAQLSGVNTPVLEYTDLQLKLTDIDPAAVPALEVSSTR